MNTNKIYAEHIKNSDAKAYLFSKKLHPNLTPTAYLNSISIPALMRMLKIKK